MTHKRQCPECERVFNMLDDDDASEWAYGHDCEPMLEPRTNADVMAEIDARYASRKARI